MTVIYPAMPAAQPPESDQHLKGGMPSVADGPPQKNAASLAKALAEIEPILAAIREAMAFRFCDPACASKAMATFVDCRQGNLQCDGV